MITIRISAKRKIIDVTDNDGNIYHNVYAKDGNDLVIEANGDRVLLSHSGRNFVPGKNYIKLEGMDDYEEMN